MYLMNISDKVNWHYTSPGGYGYTTNVAAIVTGFTKKKVKIIVLQKINGKWTKQIKLVSKEKLTPRTSACTGLDDSAI